MIKLKRVCIPLGLACNMACKYCYRDFCRRELPSELSEDMKQYLMQLEPEECASVIVGGGEPLLYWERAKEVFSYVPPQIHKKIMTNGSLLTEEIVEYANERNIEITISHDGEHTKFLRGVDIFEDEKILGLLKKVKILVVTSVITNRNPDVMENYRYISSKLGRKNFIFRFTDLMDTGNVDDLIEGFDYERYARSCQEFTMTVFDRNPYYHRKSKYGRKLKGAFNVDLQGNVISMNTLKVYGTIHNTYEECLAEQKKVEKDLCAEMDCPFIDVCDATRTAAGEHYCKSRFAKGGFL